MPSENKSSFVFSLPTCMPFISFSCLVALARTSPHIHLGNGPISTLEILSYGESGFSNSLAINPGVTGRKLLISLSCHPHCWVRIKSLEGPHRECRADPALHLEATRRSVFPVASAFSVFQKVLLAWLQAMELKLGVCLGVCGGWGRRDRQEG